MAADSPWRDEYPSEYCREKVRPEATIYRFARFLKRKGIDRGRLIDFGCGYGAEAIYMAKQGYEVTGVDINRGAMEFAAERARREDADATFICQDALEFESALEPDSVDIAVDSTLLHSLKRGERGIHISNMQRVLKPGSWFYVLAFSEKDPVCLEKCPERGWTFRYGNFYCKFFGEEEIRSLLDGFAIDYFRELGLEGGRRFYNAFVRKTQDAV
jgi:SAM-dependent methyltransferase